MSKEAIDAVRAMAPYMRRMIHDLELPRDKKVSPIAVQLVSRELADRYRTDRGYVAETVGQLCLSLGMTVGPVGRSLSVLRQLDVWVPATGKRGGGSGRIATKRIPGSELHALPRAVQLELTPLPRGVQAGTPRDSTPNSARFDTNSARFDTELRAAPRDTPGYPSVSPPPPPAGSDFTPDITVAVVVDEIAHIYALSESMKPGVKSPGAFAARCDYNLRQRDGARLRQLAEQGVDVVDAVVALGGTRWWAERALEQEHELYESDVG